MYKNIIGLIKLKIKSIKKTKAKKKWEKKEKRGKKGKLHRTATAQHKRQRFITTIKCVTEYTHIHIHP